MAPVDAVAGAPPVAADRAPPSPTLPPLKEPSPEKPSDIHRRTLVVLSFWLIVLCLGVPIWWRTTEIYRAALPLDQMQLWAEGKVCRRSYRDAAETPPKR